MSDGKHCELCGSLYVVTPRLPKFRFMCSNPGCDIMKMGKQRAKKIKLSAGWVNELTALGDDFGVALHHVRKLSKSRCLKMRLSLRAPRKSFAGHWMLANPGQPAHVVKFEEEEMREYWTFKVRTPEQLRQRIEGVVAVWAEQSLCRASHK